MTKKSEEKQLKNYGVCVPFTGYCYIEVEAEDPESAVDAAMESSECSIGSDSVEEVEFHLAVTRGNVCYAVLNAVRVEELDW